MSLILSVDRSQLPAQDQDDGLPSDDELFQWANVAHQKVTASTQQYLVDLKIVSADESQLLNHQYRNKNKPTNVLSFPMTMELPEAMMAELDSIVLGDVAVCAQVVMEEATQQNKSLLAHWAHMMVHSILHLHGYDHEVDEDAETMEGLEIEILAQLGYSNPYVEC